MDKKLIKGTSATSGKKQHLHPSAGDLIALGSKAGGAGAGGSGGTSSTSQKISTAGSSSKSSASSTKREGGSTVIQPPTKKPRTSPPRNVSSSHTSSTVIKSGTGSKVRRDPLSTEGGSHAASSVPVITASDLTTDKFFHLIEKANKSGNSELAQNVLLTGIKKLKSSNAKEKEQLQICQNLLLIVKTYPQYFRTIPILEILVTLVQPKTKDISGVKAKILSATGQSSVPPFAIFSLTLIFLAYALESHWPIPLVQLWLEDASGDRHWVDSPLTKPLTDNLLLSFGTMLPSSTLLPAMEGAGGSGGGSSPNPLSIDDSSTSSSLQEELKQLIGDNKDWIEEVVLRNRYSGLETNIEEIVTDYATEVVHKKSPDIPKNLLKALSCACGLGGVRTWVIPRMEQWLHNGKLGKVAQELLLHLCVNANCDTSSDIDVITNMCKLRLKTKPLIHFYSIAMREMVRENESNLRHVLSFVIYNELSPQRNPNNLPILGTIVSGVFEARELLAETFLDLLQKRDDYYPALRLLLREIVRSGRFECDLTKFVEGLLRQKEVNWLGETRERAFLAIADMTILSMFLSVSPQVREASAVAAVRGEPKDVTTLLNFRSLVSGMQSQAVTWMYSVVPKMFRPSKQNFLIAVNKIFLKDPVNELMTKEGWPPESEKNLFGRLCLEVALQESSLVFILMMGVSKEHPLTASDAVDIVEHVITRAAIHKTGLPLQKIEIVELLFRLSEYRHPDNIVLPAGYEPPKMAVSNFYWRAWALLCIISAYNPSVFGKTGWSDYPTLKVFMEMCMTNSFIFPTNSCTESETSEEIISRELQTAAMEKEEILEFETHLAAASTKNTINETTSLLLQQLMRLDPFGSPRTPPPWILTKLQAWNDQMGIGHLLCGSRNPDFLLDLIQKNSEPMPWLARLVSEGSFEILPDQCLCEFLMGRMDALERALLSSREEVAPGRSPRKGHKGAPAAPPAVDPAVSKEDAKLLQLLHYLREKVQSSSTDARKVMEYFLKRLSAPKMQQRSQASNALNLLIREDETTPTEDWLLDGLPSLALFPVLQEDVLVLLRQALLVENDPTLLCRYLEFLATWSHVSEDLDGIALDVANLVVERNGIISLMMTKFPACFGPMFEIFFIFMKKVRGPHKETYKWSDSQDQVLVTWDKERLEGTMNILVVHAIVMLLSSYSAHSQDADSGKALTGRTGNLHKRSTKDLKLRFSELLDIWFPKVKENNPKGFLLNTSEEAVLFPDWVKLKMIRSNNPRLLEVATRELDVEQLLLFVQHFGVPVQSMTALLYIMDTVTERDSDKLARCVNAGNPSFLHRLILAQWKRGAQGGEKFVHLLKTRCGVADLMDVDDGSQSTPKPVRTPLELGTLRDSSGKKGGNIGKSTGHVKMHVSSPTVKAPAFSPATSDKRKSIEVLSKELLQLSSPPSNRRRSSFPASTGLDALGSTPRRHSAHGEEKRIPLRSSSTEERNELEDRGSTKILGQLVDQITEVEPCIVRNALEYQLPLLFGRSESSSGCQAFLMSCMAHQAGWETIDRCLNLFLKEFDSSFDPSAILDLIQATHTNPKLFQGVDKYVPKHQSSVSVLRLTQEQLTVMAEYIVEEISQVEMKSTKFSISNLLGATQSSSAPTPKKSKQSIQSRIRLWLACAQQDNEIVSSVIKSLMEKKWRNPYVKKFIHHVYVEFPAIILIKDWRWSAKDMNMSEDEMSSLLDSISHGLITALANTQPGKDWAKKQAREYEICLRKLASLHPSLLLRQLNLMGSLLEGRVHLESSAFHQQNHNLPFIVFLALFDLMQPHILSHFKELKSAFLLYFKMFQNYGTTKDYSTSLSRFSILLHNFLSVNSTEVKEFLNPFHNSLKELSTIKYYTEVVPLQNLISSLNLNAISGTQPQNGASTSSAPVPPSSGDFLGPIITSMHDRLRHASNDDESIPVLQELDVISNRNPSVLDKFSDNLSSLLKSESESCRSLALSLIIKHSTYYPNKTTGYLDGILQLLEDENAHMRDTVMERIHEIVILAQERGEDVLSRMFQLAISSNANFLGPIQKTISLLRNYSSLQSA